MVNENEITDKLGKIKRVFASKTGKEIFCKIEVVTPLSKRVFEYDYQKSRETGVKRPAFPHTSEFSFYENRKNRINFWRLFSIWTSYTILLSNEEYRALLAGICNLEKEIEEKRALYTQIEEVSNAGTINRLEEEVLQFRENEERLTQKIKTLEKEKNSIQNELTQKLKKAENSAALREVEMKKACDEKIQQIEIELNKRFENKIKEESDKVKRETVDQIIAEGILQDDGSTASTEYSRGFFDELTTRLNSLDRERDEVKRQQQIIEMQQLLNESKQQVNEVKTQREWQKAEQTLHTAEISGLKTDIEGKLKEEELKREKEEFKRERQDFKIEIVASQLDLQRQQMMVDFGKMQNDLAEVGLGLKDFVLQKAYEFKTYELSVKEHILKMGEMVNWVDAKSLETERAKIEVMEGLSQMGLALKEHETYLEKTLLGADRLKHEADRQNLLTERQANEVALAMEKFNVEYGSKRNDLEGLMLQVEEGRFNNQAKSSMMEMDSKVLEVQTQLKGLAYERVGMDMMFREGQMRISEKENQVSMMKVQIEQKVKELQHLRELGRLENRVEEEKMRSSQKEMGLRDQIGHLQNVVDKESMRSEYLRQTMKFLHSGY